MRQQHSYHPFVVCVFCVSGFVLFSGRLQWQLHLQRRTQVHQGMQRFLRLQLVRVTQCRLPRPVQNLRPLAAKVVQICTYLQVKVLRH
jgi:hypothetical protein